MAPGPKPQPAYEEDEYEQHDGLRSKSQEEVDANQYVNDLIDRASASAMDQEEEEEEEEEMWTLKPFPYMQTRIIILNKQKT